MKHKLDPYKGIIDDRLREFPRLSARRLFDEVREAGYPGRYGRVYDYVRAGLGEPGVVGRVAGRSGDECRLPDLAFLRHIHRNVLEEPNIHLMVDSYAGLRARQGQGPGWPADPRYHVHYAPICASWVN